VRGRRNPLGVQLTGKCAEDLARVRPVASEDRRIGAVVNATNVTVVTAAVSIAADRASERSIYVIVLVGHSAARPTLSLPRRRGDRARHARPRAAQSYEPAVVTAKHSKTDRTTPLRGFRTRSADCDAITRAGMQVVVA